jgi:hypothetical protein
MSPFDATTVDNHVPIVHFFSSVALVWVPGANTTGPIVKKFGFSSTQFFYVSENFKFQCDPFSNKMGPVAANRACHKWQFYFWIFFNETWHIRR